LQPQKHIAFVIYSLDSGGAERVVSTLANYFSKIYKVTIITIIKKPSFYKLDPTINLKYCLEDTAPSQTTLGALKNNLNLIKILRKQFRSNKIDIVLSFMTTSNVISIIAAKSLRLPCIISERSNPYIYTHNSFWNTLIRLTYKKANALVVQSKLINDYYEKIVEANKIIILPNPISKDLSAKKENFLNRKKIILNVGRLDKNKSQDLLIKAFANINHADWQLVFAGDGHLLETYKNLVKDLNIAKSVSFVGNVNGIETYYNTSSIFAFTSKSEGFPNALVEAMYFELACISTDCPTGPAEVIEDNENGFLIEVNDQKALENKLNQLMTNKMLRNTFGKKAYETVKAFETKSVAEKWHKIIIESL